MMRPGTPIAELDTPCLLVDLDQLERNIRSWQAAIEACGVKLRPHIKTHKSPDIAHMQLAAGASGITVAKITEAEVFAHHGCTDIFVAYPVIGEAKWQRAARLAQTCTLTVGVESEVGARGLSEAAVAANTTIRVRVEVDLGLRRSGVPPEQVEPLCRLILSLPGLELDGLFTFRSVSAPGAAGKSLEELGQEEGQIMVSLARKLRSAGIPIREVSVGSTPTGRSAARVPGVTEVRPGTYVFGDHIMVQRGAIRPEEMALRVLCTVVSRPAPDRATVDGGSKTFSGDASPAAFNLPGYAQAVDMDAYLERMNEEHGIVRLGAGANPQVGDKIAFYPLHVCTIVNLSDELIGVRHGVVERVFPVLARGKRM